MEVKLGCIDAYAVLEANNMKLHVFVTQNTRPTHTINIYFSLMTVFRFRVDPTEFYDLTSNNDYCEHWGGEVLLLPCDMNGWQGEEIQKIGLFFQF